MAASTALKRQKIKKIKWNNGYWNTLFDQKLILKFSLFYGKHILYLAVLSISHLYFFLLHLGATVFCVAPNAVFPFELYDEEYLEQRDIYLTQCQQQLQQFIATYGPGTAVFASDE